MKIFPHPNLLNFSCPVCGDSTDSPVTLVGIAGTEIGNNMQAIQVHVSCIDLLYYTGNNLSKAELVQVIK